MIRTSYYNNPIINQQDTTFVSISCFISKWVGLRIPRLFHYRELAPPWDLVEAYKKKEVTQNQYISRYNQMLSTIDVHDTYNKLHRLYGDNIMLLCYEPSDQFCHRHIVAGWFRENEYEVVEFTPPPTEQQLILEAEWEF